MSVLTKIKETKIVATLKKIIIKKVMPNVVGKSIKEAVDILNEKGIRFVIHGKEIIPKEGSVYLQYPKANSLIGFNGEATLYVNDSVSK